MTSLLRKLGNSPWLWPPLKPKHCRNPDCDQGWRKAELSVPLVGELSLGTGTPQCGDQIAFEPGKRAKISRWFQTRLARSMLKGCVTVKGERTEETG